jgi:hypothetical protein
MTTRQLLRRARSLWRTPGVPERTNRYNRHAWVRAMQVLGDRWLFATRVQRVDK